MKPKQALVTKADGNEAELVAESVKAILSDIGLSVCLRLKYIVAGDLYVYAAHKHVAILASRTASVW